MGHQKKAVTFCGGKLQPKETPQEESPGQKCFPPSPASVGKPNGKPEGEEVY